MAYTGTSIVDYLKSIGQPSDFQSRLALAQKYGITSYTGSADQNNQLLGKVRATTTASPAAATPTTSTTAKQATLTSPDGLYKTVVTVGSGEASQLQSSGWTLGATGKSVVDTNKALTLTRTATSLPQQEQQLVTSIQNDPSYNPAIEQELKQYYPATEYPDFKWFYYTSEDQAAGRIPAGKKVGDMTSEGESAQTAATAQWSPYYQSQYEESLLQPKLTETRNVEDLNKQITNRSTERSAYLPKEERDYMETLNQYKKSFGARGLTFSGEAEKTLGTQSAMAGSKPGLLELNRAYDLGKYERNYAQQQEAAQTGITRSIEDYDAAQKAAELSRTRNLSSSVAGGVATREGEALDRYLYQQNLYNQTAPARTSPTSAPVTAAPTAASATATPTAVAPSTSVAPKTTGYQILNLDMMKQYAPTQYERLSDGRVVLKAGVKPLPGTTKTY